MNDKMNENKRSIFHALFGSVISKIKEHDVYLLSVTHKMFDPIEEFCFLKEKALYLSWHKQLHFLKNIKIPRNFGLGVCSLHTFCGANLTAYARLELLAAYIGLYSRQACDILQALNCNFDLDKSR